MKRFLNMAVGALTALMLLTVSISATDATDGASADAPEKVKKTISYNFDDDEGDLSITDIADYFVVNLATPTSTAVVNSSGIVDLSQYAQVYLMEDEAYNITSGAYTITVDFENKSPDGFSAMYIRGINPQSYSIINPKNGGVVQVFNFYEWDWYTENGGTNGSSSPGGSGIKIYVDDGKIHVDIKTYVEEALNIVATGVELDFPEGFNATGMNTYKFDDDGAGKVVITVNDRALCTVTYGGEPAPYPDGDDGDAVLEYYKEAKILGADGTTELLSIDNARICAEYSIFALGSRQWGASSDITLSFDNLTIEYETEVAPTTPTPSTPADVTPDPSSDSTSSADATAATTDNKTQAPTSGSDGDGLSTTTIVVICVCAVVAVAAVIIIVVAVKKKK